jgi:AbrB family looped-hinge helix DNA binding protein
VPNEGRRIVRVKLIFSTDAPRTSAHLHKAHFKVDLLTNTNLSLKVLLFSYFGRYFMDSVRLSSKGQVIIPKPIRDAYHWDTGQELMLIDTGSGILLQQKAPFTESALDEVAGCLLYTGIPKSIADMDKAIAEGLKAQFYDCG